MQHYVPENTIPRLFRQQVEASPDATALIEGDHRLCYAALEARAGRIAHVLMARGVRRGAVVAVALPRRADFVATLLAIMSAGGTYLCLDPELPPQRLEYLCAAAGVALVVSNATMQVHLPSGVARLLLEQAQAELAAAPATAPENAASAEDIAYVFYTSGSTGRPKGSLIPHRAIPGFFRGNGLVAAGPGEIWLQHSSILWDALTLELWPALLSGGAVALVEELRPDLGALGDALVDYQVTSVWLGASLFNALIDEAPDALASVRHCLIGGEALSLPHVRRAQQALPGMRIVNGYGPSECTVFATCHELPCPLPEGVRSVPIGRPVGDRIVHLLDASMQRVPVGVAGEICIGGPAVAVGYLDAPALTAAAFVPDPFGPPGARLYRTGDFARYQSTGTLEFIGRRDHQVKLRGFRIEMGEIEACLKTHAAVRDAVCLVRDDGGNERLVAYVVPMNPATDSSGGPAVDGWERVFDERVYSAASTATDPRFNTTGWQSSYDGSDISTAEMLAWAEDIVAQVRALGPRDVLEVGCGSGMLLLQLAADCASYTGTDISAAALDYVRAQAGSELPGLRLLRQPAHDWQGIADASMDVVLLSSVVQYFPSVDYLVDVLQHCRRALRPGGSIVLADLRCLPLARCLESAIQLAQAAPDTTVGELHARIEQRLVKTAELLVAPNLFTALGAVLPELGSIRLRLQRGRVHNELTRYRYTVVMGPSQPEVGAALQLTAPDLAAIERELAERAPAVLASGMLNARLAGEFRRMEALGGAAPEDTVAHLAVTDTPDPGIDPEDLLALAARHGYRVEIGWSEHDAFRMDASFARSGEPVPLPICRQRATRASWQSYANRPHHAATPMPLIPELRQALVAALPDYMVPAAFVLLDTIPRTPNGKLDHRALPLPADERSLLGSERVPPRNALETVLTQFYEELLGTEGLGVHDGFFDLGGHSLLVTQLASRIRKTFKLDLPLRALFEHATVAQLAEAIAAQSEPPGQAERIAAIYLRVSAMSSDEIAAERDRMRA